MSSTCVAMGIHLFLGITPRYLPLSMCKRKLQRLGRPVWLLNQCVCGCCCPAAHVPAPCRGSTALLLLALTGKGELCRCSAAWKLPLLFPWYISSPPVPYLVSELCAHIWAHWRTIFSHVPIKNKGLYWWVRDIFSVAHSLTPEGEKQCSSAKVIFYVDEYEYFL